MFFYYHQIQFKLVYFTEFREQYDYTTWCVEWYQVGKRLQWVDAKDIVVLWFQKAVALGTNDMFRLYVS